MDIVSPVEEIPRTMPTAARRSALVAGIGTAVLVGVVAGIGTSVGQNCHSTEEWGCLGVALGAVAIGAAAVLAGLFVIMKLARVPLWGVAALMTFWLCAAVQFGEKSVFTFYWDFLRAVPSVPALQVGVFAVLAALLAGAVAGLFAWHRKVMLITIALLGVDLAQSVLRVYVF